LDAIAQKNNQKEMEMIHVYALWGKDDGFVPFDESVQVLPEKYGEFLRLEALENAGHCLHDEYPEIVNEKVVSFLKSRLQQRTKE
jgi:pimeloyl-ACP methyl ester carboxylesterase